MVKEFKNINNVDILEDYIYGMNSNILEVLLKYSSSNKNIIWAANNYIPFGKGYETKSKIKVEYVTKINNGVIKPRINKTKLEQEYRIKEKVEVFTPSWMCNIQNNQIDNAWFGK